VDCAACEVTRTPADFDPAASSVAPGDDVDREANAAAASLAPAPPPVASRDLSLAGQQQQQQQHDVYLGLGSNVGNRPANIEAALRALEAECSCVLLHTSLLYETPAAYVTAQPAFLNCAVKVRCYREGREKGTLQHCVGEPN
jgi:hypothetical protein